MPSENQRRRTSDAWKRKYTKGAFRCLDISLRTIDKLQLTPPEALELLSLLREELDKAQRLPQLDEQVINHAVSEVLHRMATGK